MRPQRPHKPCKGRGAGCMSPETAPEERNLRLLVDLRHHLTSISTSYRVAQTFPRPSLTGICSDHGQTSNSLDRFLRFQRTLTLNRCYASSIVKPEGRLGQAGAVGPFDAAQSLSCARRSYALREWKDSGSQVGTPIPSARCSRSRSLRVGQLDREARPPCVAWPTACQPRLRVRPVCLPTARVARQSRHQKNAQAERACNNWGCGHV